MIEDLPFLERPNDDQLVWRFMDFTKFVSLLETRELYLTRADYFEDPYEGCYSKPNFDEIRGSLTASGVPEDEIKRMIEAGEVLPTIKEDMFLSCWHINDHQSAAMWQLYLSSPEGVAIRSTLGRLRDSVREAPYHTVFVGKVKYINYEMTPVPTGHVFHPFLHKRLSFQHENELRLISWLALNEQRRRARQTGFARPYFIVHRKAEMSVPVNLATLIESVYVAPLAQAWFARLVTSVLKRYELPTVEVVQSDLYKGPVW